MATPFAFVPRAVSKHTKEWQGISRPPPSSPDAITDSELEASSEDGNDEDDLSSTTLDEAKGKAKAVEPTQQKQFILAQDIASLISLALSDYNIWCDTDLRWKLDACLSDDTSPDDAGFVPVNYLLRRAPFRGSLPLTSSQSDPSETEVVKALRTHANHTLEVRMRLPTSSSLASASMSPSSVWYGTGKTSRKKDVGGYEVRRKDWQTLRHRPSRGWTRARWDDLTVYMECIPPQYRTVGGIARFAEALLLPSPQPEMNEAGVGSPLRIPCVALPPHYLDKPGDTPKCKGYALVTFMTKSHVEIVLRTWPWRRRVPAPTDEKERGDGDGSHIVKEAQKYGLRTVSKARWDALNEEYLLYKRYLVFEMARTRTETHLAKDVTQDERDEPHSCPETEAQTMPSSPYPFNCLVFVRNVHPETNKTTLKSLFAQAFEDGDSLDYVDFSKGMDTCYLRLASPHQVMQLIECFGMQPKTQAHGLDAAGRPPNRNDQPIIIEKIEGTKEALYWEKVPEKIRRQAVDKAINAQPNTKSVTSSGRRKRTRE